MNPTEYIARFLPGNGTRHMISTTPDGQLEIRIGSGDWYRISAGRIDDPDPIRAAEKIAAAPTHWEA